MTRGRPRNFDTNDALDKVVRVFWEKGAAGATMNDLTEATALAKPSLYAAFGDKEALFTRALERYQEEFGAPAIDALRRHDVPVEEAVRRYLDLIADFVSDAERPGGCFMVNSIVDTANCPAAARDLIDRVRGERVAVLRALFENARTKGELRADCDIDALVEFYDGQTMTLAVMVRSGADRAALARFIDAAMQTLAHNKA